MKTQTLNEKNLKESPTAPTLLTTREQEAVAAAGGVPGGVVNRNPKAE